MKDVGHQLGECKEKHEVVTLCSLKVMAERVSAGGVGRGRGRRGMQSMEFGC